ncbi:Cadherin EGF LAG seven-pass G-type receptor 1 [Stylophora pistillata]|uniref:Cadherin EGF LAG seven-pass G-type receptor 1 n=2 Tax=Stylophora pistillata TaxID=50429 RepID=A0A2B4RAF8_STYPI|nr:Cadherin EGF LAG seven-pass G-type receptor 1 [Stylophora pistillata]
MIEVDKVDITVGQQLMCESNTEKLLNCTPEFSDLADIIMHEKHWLMPNSPDEAKDLDVRQPLSQVRLSLSVSLGAGQIIFLVGINATKNMSACITAAALMQYFLMAAFCWMLVEGIYLYLFVVKVYNINTKMHMYHVMSWGLPIVMVGISLGIATVKDGLQSYTSDKYCWLSSTNKLIWIFVTFVAFIETLNILILVRVIKEITTLVEPLAEDNYCKQIRGGLTYVCHRPD